MNEIGPPFVESLITCATGWIGGETNESVVALKLNTGNGEVMIIVTGIEAVAVVVVTVTVAVDVPTGSPFGLARTLRLAGIFPLSGLTVSQRELVPVIEVV